MRAPTIAAAVVAVFTAAPAGRSSVSLLTLPQADRLRSIGTRPSAAISADGRIIAFASFERLVPDDTDDRADVYLLDRSTGAVTLQSMAVSGLPIDSDCVQPRLSGDGRFVVFETALARDSSARIGSDILVRDRETQTTRHVNLALGGGLSSGWSTDAAIDAQGTVLVFSSAATDLVTGGDANGPQADIYAYRAATGTLERVSLDSRGVQPSVGSSVAPSLSADGHYVAFTSTAALDSRVQPTAGRPNVRRLSHIYVRDLRTRVTKRVAPRQVEANGASMNASISGDGRFVAFVSLASNLIAGDRNQAADVFIYDAATDEITLVSRGPNGRTANGTSGGPSISADGRIVAFHSDASDLTCVGRCARAADDINLLPDVFLFDRVAGVITRVSTGSAGPWMEESGAPVVDGSGAILAFASKHPIDADDMDDDFDLFVRVTQPDR